MTSPPSSSGSRESLSPEPGASARGSARAARLPRPTCGSAGRVRGGIRTRRLRLRNGRARVVRRSTERRLYGDRTDHACLARMEEPAVPLRRCGCAGGAAHLLLRHAEDEAGAGRRRDRSGRSSRRGCAVAVRSTEEQQHGRQDRTDHRHDGRSRDEPARVAGTHLDGNRRDCHAANISQRAILHA